MKGGGNAALPLVVDMDGSLVWADTSLLCVMMLLGRPGTLLRALLDWRHGRARVKQNLAAAAALDPAHLPYNQHLVTYLREERAAGRRLLLATGADQALAVAVARHLGLFDAVLASDGQINLTGRAKLAAIRRTIGGEPFCYVGNSRADLAVWCEAERGICVNVRPRLARAAARTTTIERTFPRDAGRLRHWLSALQPRR
ncbi:MAG TPA: haloacid dehalogenase-like hydrolase [Stellaceae bacterium]|nr:haloacid dehalogenase-like hydrolase [Stellaceae bacterium]